MLVNNKLFIALNFFNNIIIKAQTKMISERCSLVIDRIKFPFAIIVVMLHAYTTVNLPNTGFAWNVVYLFSFIFGEMGVPCFFFISGLLFFRKINNSDFSFITNIKKRFSSLLVPYFLWNTLMIVFYIIGQNINVINGFFSGIIPDISNMSLTNFIRLYWDRGNWDNGNCMPILTPLWYVRNLFIISLFSPIIYVFLKYSKGIILLLFCYLWFISNSLAFTEVTLLFFSMGAWCSINKFDFLSISVKLRYIIITIFFITGLLDLYFHTFSFCQYNLIIHRLTIIFGIYSIFLLVSQNINNIIKIRAKSLAKYSFFLYLIHYPIILALRKIEFKYISTSDSIIQLSLYFSSVIIVAYISILLYNLLEKYASKNFLLLLVYRLPNKK